MPLYEYKCDRCHKTIEVLQKFSDTPLSVHEGCGGALARLISTSALQFKGSGFYITDYSKSKSSGSSGSNGKSASGKESSSTSESAPAKTESTPKPAASESSK
ncbi:FmdB family zinc ribbon protein [Paludibaculum fermentans]|uniref:Zinc ribbon domain-containing protein n=1 Tax=Paludibaculum fermentans TaxID=1473598 RepID=A0A7S7SM37_PALFE|nr:FmdB family zinc ribbon protein [Paludibaculum fermentans]QOY89498.1 zinc ribbon domain-containing protein [Paludibaculum fermentans]